MIAFRDIDDTDPALAHSPMIRGLEKSFAWTREHGGIDLTPSKAFKRVFVHWAAREFDWPGYSEEDLFAINKVLNEADFPPLVDIHDTLIALKLGRHYKSRFWLTKAGQALADHPGRIFADVVPFYLFRINHGRFLRRGDAPVPGSWDIFLNVLNVETEDGATGAHIRRTLYGEPEGGPFPGYDEVMGSFYTQVLRPLCWVGLLHEQRGANVSRTRDTVFTKTPLWKAVLQLETDGAVRPAIRH